MKLFSKVFLMVFSVAFVLGCAVQQKEEIDYSKIYQRSQKNKFEKKFEDIVFAPTTDYDLFLNTYSSAKIIERKEYGDEVKVKFTTGAMKDEEIWSDKVIYETSGITKDMIKKGMVVFVNTKDPVKLKNTTFESWQIGIVYSTDKLAEKGIVVVEFPKHKNDFFATKESFRYYNLREIDKPKIQDIRTFRR